MPGKVDIKPFSIILHDDQHRVVPALQDHVHAAGRGVADGIGERLLDNPVESCFDLMRQPLIFAEPNRLELDRQVCILVERFD